MKRIAELQQMWSNNAEGYKTSEIGGGVHSFISQMLQSPEVFHLKLTSEKNPKQFGVFTHDTSSIDTGRPDFQLYIDQDVIIPVEAKCFHRIEEGVRQLYRYQLGLRKHFGILTDGDEWRFYRSSQYTKFHLKEILADPNGFLVFWKDYIKPENYYGDLFNQSGQTERFESTLSLNDSENRRLFFDDTTHLIRNFTMKMQSIGMRRQYLDFDNETAKKAVESAYAYLIQFILYKVLVDNCYSALRDEYDVMLRCIAKSIQDKDFYGQMLRQFREIAEYVSCNIYKPFQEEQESITTKLFERMKNPTIDDIAPWLDMIAYINRYNFSDLKNEIFGFVYENYLKDLYEDKNKGQYFTDPVIVDFMLDEMGYRERVSSGDTGRISIIDPSCGAGTFLYSAVDRIIAAINDDTEDAAKRIENLVNQNIFGLDIAEFPLYLAEMSILMRLLPLIVNDDFKNPIENKFKIFKTKDSITEFLDVGIDSKVENVDLFSHLEDVALDYHSFMRHENDLEEMYQSMQNRDKLRQRFDFVIGNPPYIGYNECCRQGIDFTKKIKDKSNTAISLGNVYGVNLHSIPLSHKTYPPKPNLYAFFIALGLALLKDGGKICYIVPQNLLTAGDLDVIRYHLAKFITIEKIITFDGNLFVGRGLGQNKPVATSSLIFTAKKSCPLANHKVNVIHYETYTETQSLQFEKYLKSGRKTKKKILQTDLLKNSSNWTFIKHDEALAHYLESYNNNSDDIAVYYDHDKAKVHFKDKFWFDVGFLLDKSLWLAKPDKDSYALLDFKQCRGYSIFKPNVFYPADRNAIKLTKNSQGHDTLDHAYNIVWSVKNPNRFLWITQKIIFPMGKAAIITSDNKNEMLFLFALLNSSVNMSLLKAKLKTKHEKEFLVPIKAIKQYICIPKNTKKNSTIKSEIIRMTEVMLALENVKLQDVVPLENVQIQRFTQVAVEKGKLILTSKTGKTSLPIPRKSVALVESLFSNEPAIGESISLRELKQIVAIDVDKQQKIKDYIDDLVFAIYFSVSLPPIGFENAAQIKKACEQYRSFEYKK